MAKIVNIVIPDLGEFESIEVIEVLIKAGDAVEIEDGLIIVETDKASMDIPSPEKGIIDSLTVKAGDNVSTGDVIGSIQIAESDDTSSEEESTKATLESNETGDRVQEQSLVVPDLGDFDEVEVIEVHINAGDNVDIEDPLVTLETVKATMDVPAVAAGVIKSVTV